jgi:hypothetical protein
MGRKLLIAFGVLLAAGAAALATGGEFAGPGPGITGNDTGGIFPYSPDVEGSYKQIAEDYCARWARLAKVTSIHRKYGDYVSFICFDRPGRIH